ncbi:MAG: poly(A) polymerase [Candidatus Sumerlaeota bacterium]|nr:poly(A) polymerase [Candidatus Sumerlaeota bacterium]
MQEQARQIVRRLKDAGFDARWVGGCVRDALLGRTLKDIDIATDATPGDVRRIFGDVKFAGASFGVSLVHLGGHTFEVATFRRDGRYVDCRRPESVEYGTARQDALRRDFTINAIFLDPLTNEIFDPADGQGDIERRLIRTVREPRERFAEDALRLLRAIRFAARLDFAIEPRTWEALVELAPTIRAISPERIRDELTMMLVGEHPARAFALLDTSGLLALLLPEIAAMKGVEQGERYHPEGDVFVHTMLCIENVEPRTPVTCWAALLHDVGKPGTFARSADRITFYGHDAVGARIAEGILRRLRFSNDDIRRITAIVARHMRFMQAHDWNAATLRRFLSAETIHEDLAIHRADCLACHGKLANWEFVSGKLREFEESHEPVLPPPLLTGNDLIGLGYRPGPLFAEILASLQEEQLNGTLTSTEEARQFVAEKWPFETTS